jgi:hypothetical protein
VSPGIIVTDDKKLLLVVGEVLVELSVEEVVGLVSQVAQALTTLADMDPESTARVLKAAEAGGIQVTLTPKD